MDEVAMFKLPANFNYMKKLRWWQNKISLFAKEIFIKRVLRLDSLANFFVGIGIIWFLTLFLWKVPGHMVGSFDLKDKDRFENKVKIIELEDNARRTLAQIVGGVLAFAAIYIAWRRVEVANETQITDRFTKAIEQLSNENLSIRLGGIYVLARISRDSKKDHRQIMEVLTAFVREKCPLPSDKNNGESEDDTAKDTQELPTDIQAILTTVVGKIWTHEENHTLNLSKTSLNKANLSTGYLPWANLKKAELCETNFSLADLNWAYLGDANLEGADLMKANLSNTDFFAANLKRAILIDTNLSKTNFTMANMSGVHFFDANIEGTHFSEANFMGVDLRGAKNVTCDQIRSAKIDKKTQLPGYLEITWTSDTEYQIKERSR
jgi:pentapeptide repeat protein